MAQRRALGELLGSEQSKREQLIEGTANPCKKQGRVGPSAKDVCMACQWKLSQNISRSRKDTGQT
jgi:hypothetical protein